MHGFKSSTKCLRYVHQYMIIIFLLKIFPSSFFLRIHLAIATLPLFAILRKIRLFVLSLQANPGKKESKDTHLASRYTDVYTFGVKFVLQRRIVTHLPRIMYIHTFHNRWIHTCAIQHTLQTTCTKFFPPTNSCWHRHHPSKPGRAAARGRRSPEISLDPIPNLVLLTSCTHVPRAKTLTDSLALAIFELDDLHVRNIALDGLGLERCLQTPAHDLGTDVGVPKVRNACLTPLLHMHLELFIAEGDFSSSCGSCCATPLLFAHANPWS